MRLTKHEGAGNDFLVTVVDGHLPEGPELARALCDRHRGVGADGLIAVARGVADADLTMQLWNADGSEAEMSGNGIRCLAQAAVEAGLATPPHFTVATAAGVRTVDYRPGPSAGEATASVDMGEVRLGPDRPPPSPGRRACEVDVGNPHLVVVVDDVDAVDLERLATELGAGVNVEIVAPTGAPDELVLRVWERGVGETLACGTGTCAAAAAAHRWGMVGSRVRVANPGGPLDVRLVGDGPAPVAFLAGPVRKVADLVVA